MTDYLSMARQVGKDIGFPVNIAVVGNRFSTDPQIFLAQEKIFKSLAGDHFVTALQNDEALERGLSASLAGLIRKGFNVAASEGREIIGQIDFTSKGPRFDELSPHNMAAIAKIAETVEGAGHQPERRKEWIQLCLGRAEYLDKLVDPSVRQQKSDFVPHRHGPHCDHHHHHH